MRTGRTRLGVAGLGLLLLAWLLAGCGDPRPDNHALVAAIGGGRPAEVTVQGRVVEVLADEQGPEGRHERSRLQNASGTSRTPVISQRR